MTGFDKNLLPGVEVRPWLTQAVNQFVCLKKSTTNCKPQNFGVKFVNATCLVHMLELRHKTHLSIHCALLEKMPNINLKKSLHLF